MRLWQRTLRFFPAQLAGTMAQFAAMFVWTHFLSPSDFGVYAIVWAVQEMVHLLVLAWWSSFVLRYLTSHSFEGKRAALDRTESAILLLSIVVQIGASLLALGLFASLELTGDLVFAALSFIVVRTLTAHFLERARATNAALSYSLLQITGPVAGLALGLAAVAHLGGSPRIVLWAYVLTHIIGIGLALPGLGFADLRPRLDRPILLNAMRYGAPLMLASMFGWVGSHGLRLVVDHWQGAAAVGLVSVGWWLGQRATSTVGGMVTVSTFNVAVERIREAGLQAALPQIATNGALLLAVLVPTMIGVLALNEALVRVMVAAPFQAVTIAVLPMAVLSGALRTFRNHVSDQMFLLCERPKVVAMLLGLEAALTLLLCFAGLVWGGLVGAVGGCLAASVLVGALSFGAARRVAGLYLRWQDIFRIAFAGGAMAALLWLLPAPLSLTALLLTGLAGGFAYLAGLALMYGARLRARFLP